MKNDYIGSLLTNKVHPFNEVFHLESNGKVQAKKKILVYDIETTGLDHITDDITQLAYIVYSENFEVIKKYSQYFKLKEKRFHEISHEVIQKTKITKELLDNGISVEKGIKEFLRDAENCIVASYNGWVFDDKFITTKICKYIQKPFWPTLFASDIDVFILSIGALFGEIEKMGLQSVVTALNIDFDSSAAHNALYDVNMTASIIPALVRRLFNKHENFSEMCRYRTQKDWYRHWRYKRYEEPWPATEKQVYFANRLMKTVLNSKGMKGPLEWLFLTITFENDVENFLKNNDYDFVNRLSKNEISELIGFILWFQNLGV